MNKADFQQLGGFPFETNTLNFMQNAYRIFNAFGGLIRDKSIVKGCSEIGNEVTNGEIYVNGELIEFRGGIKQSTIIIKEEVQKVEFKDKTLKEVYKIRYATFGSGINEISWEDFKAPDTLFKLMDRIEKLENRHTFTKGMVLLWNRPVKDIPNGFQEYIAMRGRTPIGRDPDYSFSDSGDVTNFELNLLGKQGGVRELVLEEDNLPNIKVKYPLAPDASSAGANVYGRGGKNRDIEILNIGKSKPIKNMSPYRVVEFIEYIGE